MRKEKRKVEEIDSSYEGKSWRFAIEWLLVLLVLAIVVGVIYWVLSPVLVSDAPFG